MNHDDPFDPAALRLLLDALRAAYPGPVQGADLEALVHADDRRPAQLQYLEQHGLVTYRCAEFSGGLRWRDAAITAAGIDWLRPDGGLTGEKRMLTVRIADETVRALLTEHIRASSEPDSVKQRLANQIRSLPAEALSKLAAQALEAGVARLPDGVRWLQTWLGWQ